MTEAFALYIHVPFCSKRCPYCDFNTYAVTDIPEAEYVEALCKELEHYAASPRFAGRRVFSIFWGGGTPSLFSPRSIARVHAKVRELFDLERSAEVTLEANPGRPSLERYAGFYNAGINRISFGAQSFRPEQLAILGRDHRSEEIASAVEYAIKGGISNISVDLIFGVAGQELDHLKGDLLAAAALPIAHISTYALTIEPGTPFFQRQQRGLLKTPSDDLVREMLDVIPEALRQYGFERYEISNYARGDQYSRHNDAYWSGRDYLGIGAGAHSYVSLLKEGRRVSGERWSTLASPDSYMRSAGTAQSIAWEERLSIDALMFEFFYLGLRRMRGVSLHEFAGTFGVAAEERYGAELRLLAADGFVALEGDRVRLTPAGIALADSVYERLVE